MMSCRLQLIINETSIQHLMIHFIFQLAWPLLASLDHLGLLVLPVLQDLQDYQVWLLIVRCPVLNYRVELNDITNVKRMTYWFTSSGPIGPAGLPGPTGQSLNIIFFCFLSFIPWILTDVALWLFSQVLKATGDIREIREYLEYQWEPVRARPWAEQRSSI